jgi:ABC transporter, ATP-binding protein
MKLSIKNVGILSKVDLEINGITVIAGENDTGKSTISKSLYAMFNGFYRMDEKIIDAKVEDIIGEISIFLERNFEIYGNRYFRNGYFKNRYIEREKIYHLLESDENINEEQVRKLLKETLKNINEDNTSLIGFIKKDNINLESLKNIEINDLIKRINETKLMNEKIINKLLEIEFNSEFNNQVNNLNTNESSRVNLSLKNINIEIQIKEGKINLERVENFKKIYSRIEYIDSISILDTLNESSHHFNNLISDLQRKRKRGVIDAIKTDERIQEIFSKVTGEKTGKLLFNKTLFNTRVTYKANNETKPLDIRNVSAGLKSFLIIKTLLENGILEEKGVIILDEPEIHLHPEWQVLFAELIVLIQKEFNMHILLTTHSPYFLYAIELFTKKYEINEKCKVYFSEKENEKTTLKDVTENTEIIFRSLSNPFFKLEDMEVKMEEENCEK